MATLPGLNKGVTKDPTPPVTDTVISPITIPDGTTLVTTKTTNETIDNVDQIIDYISGDAGPNFIPQLAITNLVSDLVGKEDSLGFTPENIANKGAVSGYAELDSIQELLLANFPPGSALQVLRRNAFNTGLEFTTSQGEIFTWTNNHSMATFKLTAAGANNLILNAPFSMGVLIEVNAGSEYFFDVTEANFFNNNIINLGTLNTHTIPSGTSTFALFSDNLSVFAGTTSAQLSGVITDETGSGLLVFGTSPTIVTPTIASFLNATHDHSNAVGGGNLTNTALTSGVFAAITGLGVQSQALVMSNNGITMGTGLITFASGNTIGAFGSATALTFTTQFEINDGGNQYHFNATRASWFNNDLTLMGILSFQNADMSIEASGTLMKIDMPTGSSILNRINNAPVTTLSGSSLRLDTVDLNVNGNNIINVGFIDFGTGSADSGLVRLPNGGSIEWEASPAGVNSQIFVDATEQIIINSGGGDIQLQVAGTPEYRFSPTQANFNGNGLTNVGFIDFGTGSADLGEVRLKNSSGGIQFEAAPAGVNGAITYDAAEQMLFAVGGGFNISVSGNGFNFSPTDFNVIGKDIINVGFVESNGSDVATTGVFRTSAEEISLSQKTAITGDSYEFTLDAFDNFVIQRGNDNFGLNLKSKHTTPVTGNQASIAYIDDNSVGAEKVYAQVKLIIFNSNTGIEEGVLDLDVIEGGSDTQYISLNNAAGNDISFFKPLDMINNNITLGTGEISVTSQAVGDLFKNDGAGFSRFARGTALQVLRVNAGGTDLEYADASGGASALNDLTDVTITGTTIDDLLVSDVEGAWVNRQGVFTGITGLGTQVQTLLMNANDISLATGKLILGSADQTIQSESGSTVLDVSATNDVQIHIGGGEHYRFNTLVMDFFGNGIENVGTLDFFLTGSLGLAAEAFMVADAGGFTLNVPSLNSHDLRINLLSEYEFNATQADFNGNNIVDVGLLNQKIDNTTAIHELEANHTTPVNGQIISQLDSIDDSSTGVRRIYGQIRTLIEDPTNLAEDADMFFSVIKAGTLDDYISLNENNIGHIGIKEALNFTDVTTVPSSGSNTIAQVGVNMLFNNSNGTGEFQFAVQGNERFAVGTISGDAKITFNNAGTFIQADSGGGITWTFAASNDTWALKHGAFSTLSISGTSADWNGTNMTEVGNLSFNAAATLGFRPTGGLEYRVLTSGAHQFLVNAVEEYNFNAAAFTLTAGNNILMSASGALGYLEMGALTTPATPADGFGRFYTKEVATVTTPFFIGDDGTELDLTPSVPTQIFTPAISTMFEDGNRFSQGFGGGGDVTFDTAGVRVKTGSSSGNSNISATDTLESNLFLIDARWFMSITDPTIGSDVQFYWGSGSIATGTNLNFNSSHFGFKLVRVSSGTIVISATNANGSTETATDIGETDAIGQYFIDKTSADIKYYRKAISGTAYILEATHTTNLPVTGGTEPFQCAITNAGVASTSEVSITSASYQQEVVA